MKNKKSSLFFLPLLVLISLIILTELFFVLWNKNSAFQMPLGKRQMDLYDTYLNGEETLFYIDQSSKYSLQQAVYDLGKNGGISKIKSDSGCGQFYGYSVWNKLENSLVMKSCLDEKQISDDLAYFFDKNLNGYLAEYPSKISASYTYEVKEGIEIVGKPKHQLNFEIKKEK